jgi:tetratricopeptide (TPR) repeat protein
MLLTLAPAWAAPPAPSPTATKKAKELFGAGQKLYQQGQYAEAIARFEEAYSAKPHPVIYFNIGRCYEELGRTGEALKAYKTYLRLSPEAKDRNQVAESIANLERKLREKGLQQLTVVAEPAGAAIEIDGKPLGVSPLTVDLTTGDHRLAVTLAGYDRIERTITMTLGQASELNVTLVKASELTPPVRSDTPVAGSSTGPSVTPTTTSQPAAGGEIRTEPLAPKPKPKRLWTYVAGGIAVAGLGAGIGLGVAADGEAKTLVAGQEIVVDGQPTRQPWPDATARHDRAVALATGANVSYGLAGAALITAVVLFFVEK